MAALCTCKPEAEKDRLAYGGVHVSIEDAELIKRVLAHRAQYGDDDLRGTPFVPRAPPQPSLF
jgi:hypothetical protein